MASISVLKKLIRNAKDRLKRLEEEELKTKEDLKIMEQVLKMMEE